MAFSAEIVERALVACGRYCCLCHKFCGNKIETHHIVSKGGDTFDNCVPLCFDCHAEVGSYNAQHPKGRKFSPSELKGHRDTWYQLVKEGKHLTNAPQQSSSGQDGSELSRVGKFLRWCNNHKLISAAIIIGLVVIAISQFTDAVEKIRVFYKTASPVTQPSQSMVNSPGGMQAGRDIHLHVGSEVAIPRTVNADTNAPLKMQAFIQPVPLDNRITNLLGIDWAANYVEVRLDVANRSELKLEEIDLLIASDTHIVAMAQITTIPGLRFTAVAPMPDVWFGGTNGNMPILPITQPASPHYRITCPTLLHGEEIKLLVATAAVNPAVNGRMPERLFAPRTAPKAITAQGTYLMVNGNSSVKYVIATQSLLPN